MSIESSQIVWPLSFVSTLVSEDRILPNSYTINVSIVPIESSSGSLGNGYKKIKYFVESCLHNSIFLSSQSPFLEPLSKLDNNLVLFPSEPYDLFVGHVLYTKFLTISQKYFHIDMISIDSAVGDSICYNIYETDSCGINLEGNFWWNIDRPYTGHGDVLGWIDIDDAHIPRFEPKIIKGGKDSEN
jgi:hypothetical protein